MDTNISHEDPWSIDQNLLATQLHTTTEGLSESEAVKRLEQYGKNTFKKREHKGPFLIFIKQLASPLIFILIGAGIVTFLLKEWVETVVIALAVLINAVLGFFQEYHAENTLDRLTTYIKDRSRVIRNSHEQEIDSDLLVVGDVIKLAYGTRIPADARIISLNNLRIDEAILTGESAPVQKNSDVLALTTVLPERTNMAHAGTLVVDGFATAIITETGERTEIGKIAGLVSGIDRAVTPIQRGIGTLAWTIFVCVIVLVAGIFILGIFRGQPLFEMLVLAAAVAVGAVPEALPIALTVILSIGAERIAKKKGITRTLIAVETLGSATLILTDKTGTLTRAEMELVGAYSLSELTSGTQTHSKKHEHTLMELALHNVDVLVENPTANIADWTFKGRPFEVNIVKNARDAGIDISRFASQASPLVMPFNSTNKFSVADADTRYAVMGAPDILLARSSVSTEQKQNIESWVATASRDGNRLIALATMKKNDGTLSASNIGDLDFIGILAFHDPIRPEVPEAVAKIESLGVRVVMLTGDLKGTALAVGREIGWEISEDQALSGEELRILSDEELLAMLPKMRIFARVTPEDKLRIGMLYRQSGEIVAMTGDGVNDAPALKAMDIGVAIGSGSDVAKSAADLVLLDDDFQTISMAIQEGRRILVNIRKTVVYLMANSLADIFIIGGSLLLNLPLPLTALQIIWVNLFTGSLPALAFAYDENFDHESSGKRTVRSIFTPAVNAQIFGIGIISSGLLFGVYYGLILYGIPFDIAQSIFFVCFASYVSVVAFSFRSLHKPLFSYPLFSNRRLNTSIIISLLTLVITMVVPGIRNIFGLAPMPLNWLWFIAGWIILNVLIVEIAKFIFRKR